MEGIGLVEKFESFIRSLMIHAEEASGCLCSPVGCRRFGENCWSFGAEVADMGMVNGGTISRVEEGVVVDQIANFARKLEEGKWLGWDWRWGGW